MLSYIVTGVILVYNDIVIIVLCVFAVYGAYALFREISMLFSRKNRVAAAVRIKDDEQLQNDAVVIAEQYIATHTFLERAPVLLCDKYVPSDLQKYGYEIYIKQTEEK